jgi:hypothetical protein
MERRPSQEKTFAQVLKEFPLLQATSGFFI